MKQDTKKAILCSFLLKKLNEMKLCKGLEYSYSEKHFCRAYEILRKIEPAHAEYYYSKYLDFVEQRKWQIQ